MEEPLRFRERLADDRAGHERCRCRRDRAAGAFEADVADDPVLDLHVDRDPVAAEWVVSLGMVIVPRRLAVMPRVLVVVEDDLLVQIAEFGHQPSTSRTRATAAARASTSAWVL